MKNKIFICIVVFCLALISFFLFEIIEYKLFQQENKNKIDFCSQTDNEECYRRMFELLLPQLLVNNVKIGNEKIELINLDSQTRIDIHNVVKKADALLGYGVYFISEFEDNYTHVYGKNAYIFDCGVPSYTPKSSTCFFFSECIASDKFLVFDHMFTQKMQVSSGSVHTLRQKLKELNLEDKKVYIKMDIVNADILGIQEIIKNSENVLGFNLALYIQTPKEIIERIPILSELSKNFVLVSYTIPYRATNSQYRIIDSKYVKSVLDGGYVYLSYVNKNIIDSYSVSFLQNTDFYYKDKKINGIESVNKIPYSNISWVVVFDEKLRKIFGAFNNEN